MILMSISGFVAPKNQNRPPSVTPSPESAMGLPDPDWPPPWVVS